MKTLTDQQKLEILCAYLPHGVECLIDGAVTARMHSVYYDGTCSFHDIVESEHGFESVQPILRHPDDMTEEEILKLVRYLTGENNPVALDFVNAMTISDYITNIDGTAELTLAKSIKLLNYLHSIHIDTFDAIEAGFAVRKNINETTKLRVRFQPNDCDEVFTGTVIENRKHSYLVVPDDNLTGTAHWSKLYCDIIKGE